MIEYSQVPVLLDSVKARHVLIVSGEFPYCYEVISMLFSSSDTHDYDSATVHGQRCTTFKPIETYSRFLRFRYHH